jgi:hypothetical protein
VTPYSNTAQKQLATLTTSARLYQQAITACQHVLQNPHKAREQSRAIITQTRDIVFMLPITGQNGYQVFWSSTPPRIEAIIKYRRH